LKQDNKNVSNPFR